MWGCGAVEMINLEAGDSCNLKFVTTDEFSSEQCNSLPSFLHYDDMLYICISQCTTAACIGRVLGIRRAWTACDILTSCRAPLINNAKRGPGTENSCTLNDENTHTSLSVHKALKSFCLPAVCLETSQKYKAFHYKSAMIKQFAKILTFNVKSGKVWMDFSLSKYFERKNTFSINIFKNGHININIFCYISIIAMSHWYMYM